MAKELEIFEGFLAEKNLKLTSQRKAVLETFLKNEKHLAVDDLFALVKKEHPEIGYATVSRTLKLIKEAGLAREVDFGEGKKRFEHLLGHKHHDHLICLNCGREIEVVDAEIERRQEALARRHGLTPLHHRLEIFGICSSCSRK